MGVKESSGDFISDLACHLEVEIYIPPVVSNKKSAYNLETVQDRRKVPLEHE